MNRKKMLKIIGVIIGIMILFPPVIRHAFVNTSREITANDYAFLLAIPTNWTINVSTLVIQIFGALIIGGIAYVSFGKN
jgi:hypothetical protein